MDSKCFATGRLLNDSGRWMTYDILKRHIRDVYVTIY